MRKYILIPIFIYFLIFFLKQYSQEEVQGHKQPNKTYVHVTAYIEKYQAIAIKEMQYSGIPASITMAQGMLESSYGRSELAKQANNHFGIKCKKEWGFNRYNIYSDEWNLHRKRMEPHMACFRFYENVSASFRDHSNFLKKGERYANLFKLNKTNYKGWAKGLQKAGYATDPKYAKKLIQIIKRNRLDTLDQK